MVFATEGSNSSNDKCGKLRVFFMPFFATGHLLPMVEVARLFATRGVDTTVLVSHANADIISATVDLDAAAGLPIRIFTYTLPSAESFDAASNLTAPHHDHLLRLHRPDAVVSDSHFPWTTTTAKNLNIPRIIFHAIGLFPVCVMGRLFEYLPHLAVADDTTPFLVPNLPDPIHLVRSELPDFLRHKTEMTAIIDAIAEADRGSFGVVVNSFADMEAAYADSYHETGGLRSWFVGPVAIANVKQHGASGPNFDSCMRFLEGRERGSVVYVCFGSWPRFTEEQKLELALGLEKSGRPFIWVLLEGDQLQWLPAGYEKRVEGRGLVVKGWTPQTAVLNNPAIGGFVTHCGWNSLLEGVTSQLPMATWPLTVEQFINEKLIVDVLKVAVKVSMGSRSTEEKLRVVVPAEEISKAVEKIMQEGGEAEERRGRVAEMGKKARAAVKEGGSSFEGLTQLIDEIRAWHKKSY